MTLKSYPKINLYLKIIGYKDKYHILDSRFCLVRSQCYDTIEITESSRDCVLGDFDCDEYDNSVFRAITLLRTLSSKPFPKLQIHIQKHIPSQAGLGGGSSNAASVITAVNERFILGLQKPQLLDIAKHIGADVAFFIERCDVAQVGGFGEQILPLELSTDDVMDFEIYTPNISCDTKKVYAMYRQMIQEGSLHFSPQGEFENLSNTKILESNCCMLNDLFIPATKIYPELLDIKQSLGDEWFFSGSGSSFFRPLFYVSRDSKRDSHALTNPKSAKEDK